MCMITYQMQTEISCKIEEDEELWHVRICSSISKFR